LIATIFAVIMALQFRGTAPARLVDIWIAMKILVAAPRVVQARVFRRRGFPDGAAWRTGTYFLLALEEQPTRLPILRGESPLSVNCPDLDG
jgi:hypothetical protein